MSIRIYVPLDTTAVACGADAVVEKVRSEAEVRGFDVEIVELNSLVEVCGKGA